MVDDHAMHAEATSPPGHGHDAQVGPSACSGSLKSASIATWLQSDDEELRGKAAASGMRNLRVNPWKRIKLTISAIEEQRVTRYRKKERKRNWIEQAIWFLPKLNIGTVFYSVELVFPVKHQYLPSVKICIQFLSLSIFAALITLKDS